ncbi:MAG: polymerase subunit epsilon [Pseudomonadota bacterium]
MNRLTQLLFKAVRGGPELPETLRARLAAWRAQPEDDLQLPHYRTRYVVIDVATSGLHVGSDELRGIAAVAVVNGAICPAEAMVLDLSELSDQAAFPTENQLVALLEFIGKSPLVAYQAEFVQAFLKHFFQQKLGLDFDTECMDLAWILPDLFSEREEGIVALDVWLDSFGIEAIGRYDALVDALATAKLLQIALPQASSRTIETPRRLAEIEKARRWLRRSG